jgi:hypothetical protein
MVTEEYSIQHTADSIQQHTPYSIHHIAYSIQHTACSIQHTPHSSAACFKSGPLTHLTSGSLNTMYSTFSRASSRERKKTAFCPSCAANRLPVTGPTLSGM